MSVRSFAIRMGQVDRARAIMIAVCASNDCVSRLLPSTGSNGPPFRAFSLALFRGQRQRQRRWIVVLPRVFTSSWSTAQRSRRTRVWRRAPKRYSSVRQSSCPDWFASLPLMMTSRHVSKQRAHKRVDSGTNLRRGLNRSSTGVLNIVVVLHLQQRANNRAMKMIRNGRAVSSPRPQLLWRLMLSLSLMLIVVGVAAGVDVYSKERGEYVHAPLWMILKKIHCPNKRIGCTAAKR